MGNTIDNILENIKPIIGTVKTIKKINVGFTNSLYLLDDKYILKICTNQSNEKCFNAEIDFYLANKNNQYLPSLIYYNIDKTITPYLYEVMEKIEGESLYNVWHTLSENERKKIIKQITEFMKYFHNIKGNSFDWSKYLDEQIQIHLKYSQEINYFTQEELKLLNKARGLFSKYLKSENFVFIHNDLHFDNILYNNGTVKVIDFERSMVAPRDYELDIFFRMVKMPWKYAGEDTEQFTNLNDYTVIPTYVKEFYPELLNVPFLDQRLAIYDIVYFIKNGYKYPNSIEIKENIMDAVNIILYKEIQPIDNES